MAESLTLARPYAKAFFSISLETKDLAHGTNTLLLLKDIAHNQEFNKMFKAHKIDMLQALQVIKNVGKENFNTIDINFIKLMLKRKRLNLLPSIITVYQQLRHEYEKLKDITLYTAKILTEDQRLKFLKIFEAKFNCKIQLTCLVDKELIAGYKIQSGFYNFDASVKGKLHSLKNALTP